MFKYSKPDKKKDDEIQSIALALKANLPPLIDGDLAAKINKWATEYECNFTMIDDVDKIKSDNRIPCEAWIA